MKSYFSRWTFVWALFAFALTIGCGSPADKDKQAANDKKAAKEKAGPSDKKDPHDDHPSTGPHGGDLIELGEHEYHAELCHDHEKHTVTVYLLDKAIKKSVPIADKELKINLILKGGQAQSYTLAAKPQSDDPAGQSSRFELADEKLVDALESEETQGRLPVTIGGKAYVGDVKHKH